MTAAGAVSFSSLLRLKPPPPLSPPSYSYRPSRPARRLLASVRSPHTLLSPRRRPLPLSAQDNAGGGGEIGEEEKEATEEAAAGSPSSSVAEELKAMMAEKRRGREDGGLFDGVAAEIREIEWPAFGRVVGTTGVVLVVIAGSSVALLTVNAILAELSDRVFAGKGLQDFF